MKPHSMIPLYNATGTPVAYADDACQAIYDAKGNIVAWFEQELLYTVQGRYLGWVQHGWLYDRCGRPALFAENATGGPARPSLGQAAVAPPRFRLAALPHPLPRRQPRPARRCRTTEWTPLSSITYFVQ